MSRWQRAGVFALAVVAALALWAASPDPWSPGRAELAVSVAGAEPFVHPVELGATEATSFSGTSNGITLDVSLPSGTPTDGVIEVLVGVDRRSVSLAEVDVRIERSDGSSEIVPVLNQQGSDFTATRRPPADVGVVLGLLALVIVLWVSEVVPVFVTALVVPVVLSFTGVATASDALAPFFDPIIVLFFAGFLMAEAMKRVGLDHIVAVEVVARAGASPRRLFAAMLAISAFMSMWMSNTAAVAVLLPIAMGVTEPLHHPGYRKALVLGLAYAATIGGVGSAIGTPANLLAIDFLDTVTARRISFVEWFAFGLPMVVVFLPLMGAYLWRISKVRVDPERFAEVRRLALAEHAAAPRLSLRQWVVIAVFAAVMVGWLTQQWHEQSPGIVALAGAIVLFALGSIDRDDVQRINWPTLLTFGGGLALGTAMVDSGASDWIVGLLGGLGALPSLAGVAVVAAVALGLTTVASNTGSAATLIPLAIPLAGVIGVEPAMLVAVVAIASSVDFALVIGTPPTMLAYSTDLFTVREILRKGAVLDVIGIVALVAVVVPLWQTISLV